MVKMIKQTNEQKVQMYMKYTKAELVDMLIEANKSIAAGSGTVTPNGPGRSYKWHAPEFVTAGDPVSEETLRLREVFDASLREATGFDGGEDEPRL